MIKCGTLRFITQKITHAENFQVKKNVMRNLKPKQALYTGVGAGGAEGHRGPSGLTVFVLQDWLEWPM